MKKENSNGLDVTLIILRVPLERVHTKFVMLKMLKGGLI